MATQATGKETVEKFIGRVLDSRYNVDSVIEIGGMGTVFEGTHIRLGRKIAVKILHEELIGDDVQAERFLREARAAAEIHHRNVVDVIDIGTTKEGLPYFVMELLHGEALKVRMKRLRVLAPAEIGWIIQHTLAGLSVAHANGIIHRDVKPGNVFICKEKDGKEIVKILDFGVAKFKFRSEQVHAKELTTTGTILGTPYYMSPEQAMGKKSMVDARSDIYSCGLVLYRGLTGRNPFRGENYNEVIYNILTRDVPPPSFLNKSLPPEVDFVVMKAVARAPVDRYQKCDDFINDLDAFKDFTVAGGYAGEKRMADETLGAAVKDGDDDVASDSSQIMGVVTGEGLPQEGKPAVKLTAEQEAQLKLQTTQSIEIGQKKGRGVVATYLKVLLAVVILLAAFYGLWEYLGGKGSSSGKGGNPGPGKPAKAQKDPADPLKTAASVLLFLKGVPEQSKVSVDGVAHAEMPLVVGKGEKIVAVEVVKEGFKTFRKELAPLQDAEIVVQMEKIDPPVAEKPQPPLVEEGKTPVSGQEEKGVKKKKKKKKKDAKKNIYTTLPGSKKK